MEEMKQKYEEELSELIDDFRKEKSEKEHLRVRNKLLQDMSQIIVNKCLKPDEKTTTKNKNKQKDEIFEDISDDEEDYENLAELMKNKKKGY